MEPPPQFAPYTYVAAAVDLLTANAPARTVWLAGIWDAIGKGTPWRQAFQNAFGLSITDFYAQFDAYVAPFHTQILSLTFIGAGSPIPNGEIGGGAGTSTPYSFSLLGTSLSNCTGNQISSFLSLPAGSSGWGSPYVNQITVYMRSDTVSGNYTLGLNLPDGRSTSVSFPVIQVSGVSIPQPLISGIAPSPAIEGNVGASLDVSGSGFVPGSAVVLNGQPIAAQVLSGSELRGNISGASLLSGPLSVQVSNFGVGGSTSLAINLPVNDPHVIDIDQTTAAFNAVGGTAAISVIAAAPNDFWGRQRLRPG